MQTTLLLIANLVTTSALLCFFDGPHWEFRVDLLRHRLFGARDSLFAAAVRGCISFDSPAYAMTRQMIDCMIRFADRVGFWQLLWIWVTQRFWKDLQEQVGFSRQFANARYASTPSEKEVLDEVLNGVHASLLTHIAHTLLLLIPFALLARVFGTFRSAKHAELLDRTFLDWVDCQVYAFGKLDASIEAG